MSMEANSNKVCTLDEGPVRGLPVPHPLAFDWRFTRKTAGYLLERSAQLTGLGGGIAMLGTPSLYQLATEGEFPRRLTLIDRNPRLCAFLQETDYATLLLKDILVDDPPQITAESVVLDPPWYEYETKGFLWTATQMCQLGGHLMMSFPALGTRPGVREEWLRVSKWAEAIGLELREYEPLALSYSTPLFERNVLRTQGFSVVPASWRRGDLVVLEKTRELPVARPVPTGSGRDWEEFVLNGVSIWVQSEPITEFEDPTLVSMFPDDILPTVSRRDARRNSVHVWTAGNRVFTCQGPAILCAILRAIVTNQDSDLHVGRELGHALRDAERFLVFRAENQLREIIKTELSEIGSPAA